MAGWDEILRAEPEFAGRVRAVFDAHINKVLATVRADGSPRVSGTEMVLREDGCYFSSMTDAWKARDLHRDPRFALHSASPDPPKDPTAWAGDAKLSGRAVEVTDPEAIKRYLAMQEQDPPGPFHLFQADIRDLVLTRVGTPADHLLIEFWREGLGLEQVRRK
jgi:hypothetical protein